VNVRAIAQLVHRHVTKLRRSYATLQPWHGCAPTLWRRGMGKTFLRFVVAAMALGAFMPASALAQGTDWPTNPVRFIKA